MSPTALILTALFAVPFAEPPAVRLIDPATLTDLEVFGDESPLPGTDDAGFVYARRNLRHYALTNDARCLPEGHPDLATNRSIDNRSCDQVLACWHPSDPVGTRRHLYTQVDTTAASSSPYVGTVVWDEGLVAFGYSSGIYGRTFRCELDGVLEGTPLKINAGTQLALPPFHYAPFLLGTRVCGFWNPAFFVGGPEQLELACVDGPDQYGTHSSGRPVFLGQTILTFKDLDAHLGVDPLRPNSDGTEVRIFDQNNLPQPPYEQWVATPEHTTRPDGRVYLTLIRRTAATDGMTPGRYQSTRWLVSLPPNATALTDLTVLHRPRWPLRKLWPTLDNPELELGRPLWDPQSNLLIFEANGQEYSNIRVGFCDMFGNCYDDIAIGTAGKLSRGFFVLATTGDTHTLGYVSATDAYFGTARSYVQPAAAAVEGAALVRYGDHVAWVFSSPSTAPMTRLIAFSPEHFDLDGDGLTASEEAALSTSDLDFNSDDDYVMDRVERDLGFDPTDPDDAPALPPEYGASAVTTSALIQRRFGHLSSPGLSNSSRLVRSHNPKNPVCEETDLGRCYDASGRLVATFPLSPHHRGRALSYRGHHLVTFTAEGEVESLDLFTHEQKTLGAPTLPELDSGAELRLFPLDDRTVFFARMPSLHPAIWRLEDGNMTLVFDLDQAARTAGLTTPPSSVVATMGLYYDHFQVLGFSDIATAENPRQAELVFAVQGHWRRYLLGLRPDGELREIMRVRHDGVGDIDTSAEWLSGLYVQGPIVSSAGGFVLPTGLRLYTGETFRERPVPANDTLIVEQLIDPDALIQPQQAGLHELVAFRPSLSPGEVLVFISRWRGLADHLGRDAVQRLPLREPGMLFRVHPRGGMVPAWSLEENSLDRTFVEVTALDLDHRHHLCMVDRGADELRVYAPLQSGGVPELLVERFAFSGRPDLTDCRWRKDGGLTVIADDRILTRPADSHTNDPSAFVDEGPAHGRTLAKGPGADLELVEVATFIAGPEAAFARLTYDGDTLTTPWGKLSLESTGTTPPTLALRPDGRVVLAPDVVYMPAVPTGPGVPGNLARTEPFLIADPGTPAHPTTYIALGESGRGHGHALTVVPFHRLADPWTGAPLDPGDPFAEPALGTPPSPVAPPAGVRVEDTSSDSDPRSDDDGCGGAHHPSPLWLLALALLAARTRARVVPG